LGNFLADLIHFRRHELAFATQYAELKERTLAAGPLLPGTPGTLVKRMGTGYEYWYRVYYPVPGKQVEELIGNGSDTEAYQHAQERIEFAVWANTQVSNLRKLGFQVADKATARVLVELHNSGAFAGGLVMVGTLAYMAWLNELGIIAVAARTQDIDLARRQKLKLATQKSFMQTLSATHMPFAEVPGMPSRTPSTTAKLPGAQGLRVDLLAPGKTLGNIVKVPELQWAAQTVPHYDYLLEDPQPAAMLAGGHCIPIMLPNAARLVWHKLYASTQRQGFAQKAAKDRQQALTLAAALSQEDARTLHAAYKAAPAAMTKPIKLLRATLLKQLNAYPEAAEIMQQLS
jgi:hypothetical protein